MGYLLVIVSIYHLESEPEECFFVVETEGDHGLEPFLEVYFVGVLFGDQAEEMDDAGEEQGVVVFDDEVDEVVHGEVALAFEVEGLEDFEEFEDVGVGEQEVGFEVLGVLAQQFGWFVGEVGDCGTHF